jgi:hypothetical protein
MKTYVAVTAILVALVVLSGCGYTTEGLHRTDIRTVAVPTFQSQEFRRGLEQELTRELVRIIELRTPYKVTSQERADTIIEGQVIDLAEHVLAEDEDDVVTESQVTLRVSFRWKDLRTGQIIREGQPHQAWHFAASEDQTLRSAQTTAIRKLAERIVELMEEPW